VFECEQELKRKNREVQQLLYDTEQEQERLEKRFREEQGKVKEQSERANLLQQQVARMQDQMRFWRTLSNSQVSYDSSEPHVIGSWNQPWNKEQLKTAAADQSSTSRDRAGCDPKDTSTRGKLKGVLGPGDAGGERLALWATVAHIFK
jgi:TolA-binding protein